VDTQTKVEALSRAVVPRRRPYSYFVTVCLSVLLFLFIFLWFPLNLSSTFVNTQFCPGEIIKKYFLLKKAIKNNNHLIEILLFFGSLHFFHIFVKKEKKKN